MKMSKKITSVFLVVIIMLSITLNFPINASAATVTNLGTGFSYPNGVAVDNSGNIYVADSGNNAIKKMDSSGKNIVTLGTGFSSPSGVAVDNSGNIYVADYGNNAIKKMDSSGKNIVMLGTGFSHPSGVAVDNSGNIYVADKGNNAIKKMDSSGKNIVTLGTGFSNPNGVALDNSGNIYVGDIGNNAIKKMDSSGKNIVTLGTGFSYPYGVAVDNSGNIYVADFANNAIKKMDSSGKNIVTLGTGFSYPNGVAVDNSGNIYVADSGNSAIKKIQISSSTITPTTGNFDKYASGTNYVDIPVTITLNGNTLSSIKNGTNTLVAGTDYVVSGNTVTINKTYLVAQSVGTTNLTFKFSAGADQSLAVTVADTTPATTPLGTGFSFPTGVAVDNSGNIYVADGGNGAIKKMDSSGKNIVTLGTGFSNPNGVALDNSGNIYVADSGNGAIKKMDSSGNNIVTLGMDFFNPHGVAVDNSGNIYVADSGNGAIKKMDSSGNNIVTLGMDFFNPHGVAVDNSGNIYVADSGNGAIKKMDSSGNNIVTLGMDFFNPHGVAVDNSGNIYVADSGNGAIKKMDSSGKNIVTLGTGFSSPWGVAVDNSGNIYVADMNNNAIKKIQISSSNSTITPTTGNFDKYASGTNYVDIPVTMTLNGNSLISIKNGTVSLIENIDYTTTGSAISIKKEYLATQAVGTTNLTFTFSAGEDQNLAIIINDTTVPAETTYTLTYIAGANGSITGITSQKVNSGASGTAVTAVPNTGYHFVNWSDGLATVTRTDSNVTTSSSITANFAETSSSSGGNGSTSTSGGTSSSTPTTTTTVTGSVVDSKTGETVKGIPAQVTTAADGTKTVEVKSQESIVFKEPDGTKNTLSDLTKLSFSVPVTTKDGSTTNNNNAASIILKADGTIQVNGLANGTETKFTITFDLGNGQKITIGSMAVKVASDGTVSLTSTLIDPYGIITDPTTGKAVAGANVTLYYANTDRNKAAGKIPGTAVLLPTIDGFKPNNNINPQVSDASGAYGFMVFPTSDYYIIATKDGYNKYTSPMISVEQEIVKWDFQMFPLASGVNRISGNGRVDTALEIAKASFKVKVPNVVLATAADYPDALAGSVLAYKLNAPILLVGSSEEDQAKVLDYIKANLDSTGTVYILGGTGAVSKDMETKITANGFNNINRIGGADRYETSLKIADAMKVATGTPIIIASGDNYPDALSVSSAATLNQYPILLVKGNEMPSSIMNEISLIKPSKVYIIGLQGAISDVVEAEVSQTGVVDKANVVRIGGANRVETSLEVAKYFNLGGKLACIATGNNFPDALAGSVYAAKNLAPIILVDKALSDNQLAYLKNNNLSGTTIFGGESAVSKDLVQQLSQLFGK